MLEQLLANIKLYDVKYRDDIFTFDVAWGSADSTVATSRALLNGKNFPDHTAFKFVDENVQVHEKVMVWLKDEAVLLTEGWEKRGKSSLVKKGIKFKLGEEKRLLLGSAQTGKIGITKDLEPFFFTEAGWRFSPAEIKMVLKTGFIAKPRSNEITTMSGVLRYEESNNSVYLPDGKIIGGQLLKDMRTLLKFAKLI